MGPGVSELGIFDLDLPTFWSAWFFAVGHFCALEDILRYPWVLPSTCHLRGSSCDNPKCLQTLPDISGDGDYVKIASGWELLVETNRSLPFSWSPSWRKILFYISLNRWAKWWGISSLRKRSFCFQLSNYIISLNNRLCRYNQNPIQLK